MEPIRNPKAENLPAWYELGERDGKVLVLRVHNQALAELQKTDYSKAPLVKHFSKRFGIGEFAQPSAAGFGFGKRNVGVSSTDPDWTVYECALPVFNFQGVGSGPDTRSVYLQASLSIMFTSLWLISNVTTNAKVPQLMVVEGMLIEAGIGGGSLSVTLTPAMCRWLNTQSGNSNLEPVVDTMMKAEQHMWPSQKSSIRRHDFRATCRQPKWINLTVPGDACGLDPENYHNEDLDRGYQLDPHNVDSPLQQLTFLMGLARLHDLVRGR